MAGVSSDRLNEAVTELRRLTNDQLFQSRNVSARSTASVAAPELASRASAGSSYGVRGACALPPNSRPPPATVG